METNTILAILVAALFFALYYFRGHDLSVMRNRLEALQQAIQLQETTLKKEAEVLRFERETFLRGEIELVQSKLNEAYSTIPILANQQFEDFRKNEIDNLRAVLSESASKSALAELESWKIKYEMFYRQDAINRSQSVILGKVTEHLIPFHQNFPFNPKEARFVGSPIDMIVFEGIDNEDIVNIYIIEIKTGGSSLSKRQRLIRDAVEKGRVFWRELNV